MDALKRKAIRLYKDYLSKLKKGYKSDYLEILNLICFIGLPYEIDNHNFIKQQLLNKNDTIYLQFDN